MRLLYALAVDALGQPLNDHFGDAEQFILVETGLEGTVIRQRLDNPFKGSHGHHAHDHESEEHHCHCGQGHDHLQEHKRRHGHGRGGGHRHGRKARQIMNYLSDQGVQVVISRRFGPYVQRICEQLVPVLVTTNSIDATVELVEQHRSAVTEIFQKESPFPVLKLWPDRVQEVRFRTPS